MKKVLMSIVAVLLVAVFACSFAACNNGNTTNNDGTIPGKYEDVDLNKETQKEDLATTLADKLYANIPAEMLEGGGSGSENPLSLVADLFADKTIEENLTVNLDASATITSGDVEAQLGAKADVSASGKAAISVGDNAVTAKAATEIKVEGGVTAPVEFVQGLMTGMGVDPDEGPTAQEVVDAFENVNVSANFYTDGSKMYFDLDEDLIELLQTFGAALRPDHNRFFVALGGSMSSSATTYAAAAPGSSAPSGSEPTEAEMKAMLKQYILQGIELAKQYNISVSVSETNGWTLCIKANQNTLFALLNEFNASDAPDIINEIATFNKLDVELYLGFDKQNKVSQFSVKLDIDAKLHLAENTYEEFPLGINGSLKLGIGFNIALTDGAFSLPNDLSDYESYCDATGEKHYVSSSAAEELNATSHRGPCTSCGEIVTEAHTFNYMQDNDSTHTGYCYKCGYEFTEEHDFDEHGQCRDCYYYDWTKAN